MNMGLNGLMHSMILALVLGVTVWVVQRWIRNPAVRHALWVLVLLKLVTPPLWNPELNWLPSVEPEAKGTVASVPASEVPQHVATPPVPAVPTTAVALPAPAATPDVRKEASNLPPPTGAHAKSPSPAPMPATVTVPVPAEMAAIPAQPESVLPLTAPQSSRKTSLPAIPLLTVAMTAWGVGSLVWFIVALARILRFQRCLRYATEADGAIQLRTQSLGGQLGLRRAPRVWLVPGKISPMLWAFGGRARLIVPSSLFAELDEEAGNALLLHELAHFHRRDHWVRYLELGATGFWWWNPFVWLVRRELHVAEEQACDAWVISQQPGSRQTYAEMIVKTLAFLSEEPAPTLASGIGTRNTLEGRITHIMRGVCQAGVSWQAKGALLVAVLLVLLPSPMLARAQRTTPKESAVTPADQASAAAHAVRESSPPIFRKKDWPAIETVTVVDEAGQPVSAIDVTAFSADERVNTSLRTDGRGQIRIPREWITTRGTHGSSCLMVRDGDARIGWLDLHRAALKRNLNIPPGWVDRPLRIVLLPCTETVTGTLTDPANRPLRGIRVVAAWMTHPTNQELGPGIARDETLTGTFTAPDGSFRLRVPAKASLKLLPQHPDWQRQWIDVPADHLALGRRTLLPAGRIEGRVVEAARGTPRVGDKVFVNRVGARPGTESAVDYGLGRTLSDGTFVIGSLPPGQYDAFYVGPQALDEPQGPLLDFAQHKIEVTADKPANIEFRLRRGVSLTGVVAERNSDSGEPPELENAEVFVEGPGGTQSLFTGPSGKFQFHVLPGENRVYVGSRRPFNPQEDPRDLKAQVREGVELKPIILRTTETSPLSHRTTVVHNAAQGIENKNELIVTVVDLDKRVIADVEVTAYVGGGRSDQFLRTNQQGQIRIPAEWLSIDHRRGATLVVRDGEARMGWLHLVTIANRRNKPSPPADADAPLQIVLMPRTQPVTGVLTDEADRPLAGVPVSVLWWNAKLAGQREWWDDPVGQLSAFQLEGDQLAVTVTDQEGRYRMLLPPGTGGALAPFHPDWLRRPISVDEGKWDMGRRKLLPAARLEGQVVDAATGEPRVGAWVTARADNHTTSGAGLYTEVWGRTKTDAAGNFVLGGLWNGQYDLQYSCGHAKYAWGAAGSTSFAEKFTARAVEGVQLIRGKTARANLRTQPAVQLQGKVLDLATRQPLANVTVGWFDAANPQSVAQRTHGQRMVLTDADGKFSFPAHPGNCQVFVVEVQPGPQPGARRELQITPNQAVPEIVLIATVKSPTVQLETGE